MAIIIKAEITLASMRDVQSTTRYYLLQSSTASVPAKPSANPPGGNWVKTEPSYTSGSTNSLYFTDLTVFSDGSFSYSDVSLSSSYEAAKAAYNKALAAQESVDTLEIGGRNLLLDTNAPSLHAVSAEKNRYFSSASNTKVVPEYIAIGDAPVRAGYGVRFAAAAANSSNSGRALCWYDDGVVPLVSGQQYTLSVYARLTAGAKMRLRLIYGVTDYVYKYIDVTDTGWKRVTWTFSYSATSAGDTDGEGARIYIGVASYFAGTVELCGFKLEKGTKATDWSPAPEDTEQKIEDTAEMVRTYAESRISQTSDEIELSVSTISGTLSTELQDCRGRIAQAEENSSVSLNELTQRVSDQEAALSDYRHETSTYFRFSDQGLSIGKQEDGDDSPYSITIDNEKMGFQQNGQEIAYVQYNKMHINAIEAMDRMSVGAAENGGYFDFISTQYGMGIKWRPVVITITGSASYTPPQLYGNYEPVEDDEGIFTVDFGGETP